MSLLDMYGTPIPPTTSDFAGGANRNLVQENYRDIELKENEDFEIITKTAAAFIVCQD